MTFSQRTQDLISKGIAASKDIAMRAGEQAQAWGEMGVLRIEIIQLHSQAEKLTARLGAEVYGRFVEESQESVAANDTSIKAVLAAIHEAEVAIIEKEGRYRKLGGKDSDLEPEIQEPGR